MSGSTVADVQGLDRGAMCCSKKVCGSVVQELTDMQIKAGGRGVLCRKTGSVLSCSHITTLDPHCTLRSISAWGLVHGHKSQWWPSRVYLCPNTWRVGIIYQVRCRSTRNGMRWAVLIDSSAGIFYTKHRAWTVMGGIMTVPRSSQFSRENT